MVRTRSHPEGSIAEGYVLDESITFCSRYLHGCQTRFARRDDEDENNNNARDMSYLTRVGHPLLSSSMIELDHISWIQAHRYVLVNYEHIAPYAEYVLKTFYFRKCCSFQHFIFISVVHFNMSLI